MEKLWHNISINAFHILAITGQLGVENPEEPYKERWAIISVTGVMGLHRAEEICMEQWNLHDDHILCITDGTGNVESIGTP